MYSLIKDKNLSMRINGNIPALANNDYQAKLPRTDFSRNTTPRETSGSRGSFFDFQRILSHKTDAISAYHGIMSFNHQDSVGRYFGVSVYV